MDESTDWTLDALVACGVIAASGFVGGIAHAARACPPADSAEAHAPQAWKQVWDDSRQWAEGVLGQVQTRALGESLPADVPSLLTYLPPQPESSATDPWRAVQPSETLPSRVVVLVHGLDESGFVWDDLAPALAAKVWPCCDSTTPTIRRPVFPPTNSSKRSLGFQVAACTRSRWWGTPSAA